MPKEGHFPLHTLALRDASVRSLLGPEDRGATES